MPRIDHAETLLALVQAALKQVTAGPEERRVPGVRNVLVFGALFLQAMSALAKSQPLFASWFDMQKPPEGIDELRRAFLREPKARVDYTKVELASAGKEFGPRPVNARAFFSGDRLGGTGWEIELPGGGAEKYYVALPVAELPSGSLANAENVVKRYVAYLRDVLKHAKIAS